jgi:hypothetical protein
MSCFNIAAASLCWAIGAFIVDGFACLSAALTDPAAQNVAITATGANFDNLIVPP